MLIDHYDTYLKRKYGEESKEIEKYKTKINKIYDEDFNYRFIYKARNYSQHCDLSINSIKYKIKNELNKNGPQIIANLNPMFSKEVLMTKYKEWVNTVTDGLKKKPNEFPIMPNVKEYYKCHQQIAEIFSEIEYTSLN